MIVYNFIKPRASLLIAPRGEFSPGALNIKRWKKRAYIGFSKYLKLFRLATFHASTHMEKRDIEAVIGPGVTVHTAKDLPNLAMPDLRSFKNDMGQSKALKVCFISRLVPKKNLDYAIDILRTCRPPVEFTIFGSQEDPAYWSHCRQLLGALPSNVTWEYGGELLPSEVKDTFARFDVFLFPTRGENYGHVIAESLLSGTYVLVSDQTPWVGLEEAGVGCAIPLSRQREFASRISSWSSLSVEERYARKLEIQLKAKALVIDDQDVEDNLNLLGR